MGARKRAAGVCESFLLQVNTANLDFSTGLERILEFVRDFGELRISHSPPETQMPFRPPRSRVFAALSPLLLLVGCAMPQQVANPVLVRGNNPDDVWEKAVEVLHAYQLPIERENRLDGLIETDYKVGSGILEPWHYDSVTVGDRLESSFQSIRRKATVSVQPAQGGYLVGVEVLKEIEDPQNLIVNSAGTATFPESRTFDRDLELVVGPATPDGWILLGRDTNLEQDLLNSLQQAQ